MQDETTSAPVLPDASAPILADPDRIDVARRPDPDTAWGDGTMMRLFVIAMAVMLVTVVIRLIGRFSSVPQFALVGLAIAAGVVGLAFVVWNIVRRVRRRTWRRDGACSDPAARLRIFGEPARAEQVAHAADGEPSEPWMARSYGVVMFIDPAAKLRKRRRRDHLTTRASHRFSGGQIALMIIVGVCAYLGFGLLNGPTLRLMFSGGPWQVWGAMGAGMLAAWWSYPTYIRVAPGTLDVMSYGFLGRGRARLTRYNLRTARVAVDIDNGKTRIHDASRADRPIVQLAIDLRRGEWLDLPRKILSAARCAAAAPPLPDDELIG